MDEQLCLSYIFRTVEHGSGYIYVYLSMTFTIAIVDDHLLIAKALGGVIEHFKNFEVLYEVEHGQALIEKFKNLANIPDIVLLDVFMPIMNGFETARWLKEHHPEILVLTLSMQDDDQTLIKMIKAGTRGYLLKNTHPAELEKALNTLAGNGFYYPEWATAKVFMSVADESTSRTASVKLNKREIEFLEYACTEMTYKEISEKMFCSPRTVEGYRDDLFEKLSLKTRVGLVVFAIKTGIYKV
jgi:DNA-binding NarL/FixJ family response regulator